MKRLVLIMVCSLAAGACGGDDSSGDDSSADDTGDDAAGDPEQLCLDLITLSCERFIECDVPEVGTQSECEASAGAGIDCSRAVDVSSSYDTCIDDLNSASCSEIYDGTEVSLPASCAEVILIE